MSDRVSLVTWLGCGRHLQARAETAVGFLAELVRGARASMTGESLMVPDPLCASVSLSSLSLSLSLPLSLSLSLILPLSLSLSFFISFRVKFLNWLDCFVNQNHFTSVYLLSSLHLSL